MNQNSKWNMSISRLKITYTLYSLGLGFVFYLLYKSWPEVNSQIIDFKISYLVISTIALLCNTLIGCWLLKKLLNSYKVIISYSETCKIFYLSQLSKYLPGVVWGLAMQASMLNSDKAMKQIVFSNIRFLLFITAFFLFTSSAYLALRYSLIIACLLFISSFVTVFCLNKDSILNIILTPFHKLHSCFYLERINECKIRTDKLFLSCIGIYITYLLTISTIVLAFYDVTLYEAIEISIYQCIAWVAGMLVFLVPAGMGVREVVFLALGNLSNNFSTEQIQSIAILTRFVQLIQDVILSFTAIILVKARRLTRGNTG